MCILFIEGNKSYAGLASKKGISITAAIAAAIIGSSFLIWVIPQSNPSGFIQMYRDDNGIISEVYSRHQSLAAGAESKFEQWKSGNMASIDTLSQINVDILDVQNMKEQLESASPAQEWQESYELYIQALDSFLEYLDLMQTRVENEEKLDTNQLDVSKQTWEGYVDRSINAMPI